MEQVTHLAYVGADQGSKVGGDAAEKANLALVENTCLMSGSEIGECGSENVLSGLSWLVQDGNG